MGYFQSIFDIFHWVTMYLEQYDRKCVVNKIGHCAFSLYFILRAEQMIVIEVIILLNNTGIKKKQVRAVRENFRVSFKPV